jgi:hypothetical protein
MIAPSNGCIIWNCHCFTETQGHRNLLEGIKPSNSSNSDKAKILVASPSSESVAALLRLLLYPELA